jgi:hypothetical protein
MASAVSTGDIMRSRGTSPGTAWPALFTSTSTGAMAAAEGGIGVGEVGHVGLGGSAALAHLGGYLVEGRGVAAVQEEDVVGAGQVLGDGTTDWASTDQPPARSGASRAWTARSSRWPRRCSQRRPRRRILAWTAAMSEAVRCVNLGVALDRRWGVL